MGQNPFSLSFFSRIVTAGPRSHESSSTRPYNPHYRHRSDTQYQGNQDDYNLLKGIKVSSIERNVDQRSNESYSEYKDRNCGPNCGLRCICQGPLSRIIQGVEVFLFLG